jgi:predicted porin
MKKTLIALAALAATGAFAQVTVYGRMDAGYGVYTTTTPGATAGSTVDTKSNGVQSKNSVSSLLGIKGSEDLGGGLKANFVLEGNLDPAVGAAYSFDRTSLLGLSGGFGSVAFGRDYVPTFKLTGVGEVNGFSKLTTIQNPGPTSVSNLVFYSTPVMSGFQVNVAYGNNDTSKSTDTTGETSNKTTNLTATYNNGPLMVGVGTGTNEVKTAGSAGGTYMLGQTTLTGIDKTSFNVVAASYDFGKFALKGAWTSTKATYATGEAKFDELNIGATVPMGKATLIAQVGNNKVSNTGAAEDWTGTDFVVGVDYALSAKTALYAKTGTVGKVSGNGNEYKTVGTAVGIKTVF